MCPEVIVGNQRPARIKCVEQLPSHAGEFLFPCDAGRVVVNGKPARASYDVKVGDIIEVTLGARSVKIRVLEVSEYATKENADRLFESVV